MPGRRLCAVVLLVTLALTISLLGHQWALQARPQFDRRLDVQVCKGFPSSKQQLVGDILNIICALIGKPGANFLVFGLGRDSPFWFENTAGITTFLENHPEWVKFQRDEVKQRTHLVNYTTTISKYREVLKSPAKLTEFLDSLPQDVKDTSWDVILVDSPMGDYPSRVQIPGRMQSIYAARELARAGTVVFVDDFNRHVERVSALTLLRPYAKRVKVLSNGHLGTTAMFVMAPSLTAALGAGVPDAHGPLLDVHAPRERTVCKGSPSAKQQLAGGILDTICEHIGKPGANFLVFGLGRDSPFWFENTGGIITFLENHPEWAKFQSPEVRQRTHFVTYTTQVTKYRAVLKSSAKLRELLDSLPQDVKDTSWDVILVDSPMGDYPSKVRIPGRMQSIYAARELAHAGTVIFVDDFERPVERTSALTLLKPYAERVKVLSNGHLGKTAMFVMARS